MNRPAPERRSATSTALSAALITLVLACRSAPAALEASSAPPKSAPPVLAVEPERLADLEYVTFVTGGPARDGLPLLVVLHSMGAGPEEFAPLFSRLSVPVRVLSPRGRERAYGGSAWWAAAAYASPETDAHAIEETTELLARFLAAAEARYRTGPAVVTGMSQGGDLSFALALRHPDRVRAALPLAGRILPALWTSSPGASAPPIDAFHGRADSKARFERIEAAVSALRARGLPIALHAYEGLDHDTSPAEEQDVLRCAERRLQGDMAPSACRDPLR
jgi:phospholipase/carboxylesterase